MTKAIVFLFAMVLAIFVMSQPVSAAEWRGEWETALQKGKAEGKIVLAIPPSAPGMSSRLATPTHFNRCWPESTSPSERCLISDNT